MSKRAQNDPRYESMLFNYETIMKQDYRNGTILDIKRTLYKEKPKRLNVRHSPLKDTHTLSDWKGVLLPIDLMVKPKEVVRTDPKKIQEPYIPLEDLDKDRVRSTRPRLVMTPAVSMDDIEDEYKRQILTKEMYTSSVKSAMEQGITSLHAQPSNMQAPLQGTLSPANPMALNKLQFPYISPEWRMRSVAWDGRQVRAYCDPSKEYYLSQPLRCKFCIETAARDMNRKMLNRIKRNDL